MKWGFRSLSKGPEKILDPSIKLSENQLHWQLNGSKQSFICIISSNDLKAQNPIKLYSRGVLPSGFQMLTVCATTHIGPTWTDESKEKKNDEYQKIDHELAT